MAKKVVPFENWHTLDENDNRVFKGLRHLADTPLKFLYDLDGENIVSDKDVEPGDKFLTRKSGKPSKNSGVFFDFNKVFEAELKIDGFYDFAKSSVLLEDMNSDVWYVMYPAEFLEMSQYTKIENGVVNGTFRFVTKGSSTGIQFVG